MKAFYILTLAFFSILGVNAQNKEFLSAESCPFKLGEPIAVTKAEDNFITSKLSPDDKKLMVTKQGYRGIYIIDLESNNQHTNVTDEEKVGYDSEWTQNGDAISFKSKQSGETKELVNYNLKRKTISPANHFKSATPGINNNREITVEFNLKRRIVEATDGTKTWDKTKNEGENTVFFRFIISPDKTKVLVHRNNGNMYVYALDGNGLLFNLGHGLCQSWTPDNNYLVYFISHDNGYYTTESDIYVSSVDGMKKWRLTNTPDQIEKWPHISEEGRKLTYYDEKSNRIYVTNFIKK